ncbi:MAG TPA: menaquinone biosynthesis protein [Mycobacteriales bacterium]|nr:menaquinone biosynthesis protein [Mycobacteriales bacterium]
MAFSEPDPLRRPRVGHIQFLNCLPLYYGLVESRALLEVDLRKDTPDRLGERLLAGDLDIGPISAAEYVRHAADLLLLPGLAVGSDGPVLSVCLVSKRPPAELTGGQVALGSTSRTSVLLARMWLEDCVGVRPEYFACPPDLGAMLLEADAAVLIGDVALRARRDAAAMGLHHVDLGAAWQEWTGLPMVFAVWAVRREFAEAHPGLVKGVHAAFRQSLDASLGRLPDIAQQAARWEPFTAAELTTYFRALDFRLGERQLLGLREFARRAAQRGALPAGFRESFAEV